MRKYKLVVGVLLILCGSLWGQSAGEAKQNDSLKIVLIEMLEADVSARDLTDSIENQYGDESLEFEAVCIRESNLNVSQQEQLAGILDKFGWPGNSLVSPDGCFAAFIVLQHSSHDYQKMILPLVYEALDKKEIAGSYVALLVDRIKMFDGEKQVYGSQVVWDEALGGLKVYPIDDEINVDTRRKEVGLPPMKDYLAKMGISYSVPEDSVRN
ncbi:MAG: hypothetical protein KAR42_09935 [candidate division Zixibacteria bacterium]|nr:hypothetical protein [candidate division Zixibacteria bacterium]